MQEYLAKGNVICLDWKKQTRHFNQFITALKQLVVIEVDVFINLTKEGYI